jgi:hypothetical protein
VSIWDISTGQCRWPLGESQDPPFFYCGEPTVSPTVSWCQEHARIAFTPGGLAIMGGRRAPPPRKLPNV